MLEKPVIIIGGGLWGSLLALRLKQRHPHVRFELYESSSTLGEGLSLSFHQSDISAEAMVWLRPFITHQWNKFQVDFPKFHKSFESPYFAIHSQAFDKKLKEMLEGENVHLNQEITVEEALFDGAFVIDTRNRGYFKAQGYQKSLSLLVKVSGHHSLKSPMTVDATVEQKNGFRYLQYLPVDEDTLLVKDTRYSGDPALYNDYFEEDILNDIKMRGWEPVEVLNREHDFRKVPMDQHVAETSGRVIRLEGFYHDMTGEVLPDAVRLIDRMVNTSFRYGELKEVLKNYQIERESKKKVLRTLNKMVYQRATACHNRYQFMQLLYQLPSQVRQKFYAGDLEIKDVALAFMGKPIVPLFKLATQVLHLPLKAETNSVSP